MIFSVPQAAANAAITADALVMRRTLIGRLMRAKIIRNPRRDHGRQTPALRGARLAAAVIILVLCSALGGCARETMVGPDRTLALALTEYRLNPRSVHARAGTLTILVHNYGRLTHNLVISAGGRSVGSTRPVGPGQSFELLLTLGPGTYQMASTILSDEALGEYGTLTVTPATGSMTLAPTTLATTKPAAVSRRTARGGESIRRPRRRRQRRLAYQGVARSSSNGGNHRRRRRGRISG